LRDIKKGDLRHKLGLVLQDTFLFSDTVMEKSVTDGSTRRMLK